MATRKKGERCQHKLVSRGAQLGCWSESAERKLQRGHRQTLRGELRPASRQRLLSWFPPGSLQISGNYRMTSPTLLFIVAMTTMYAAIASEDTGCEDGVYFPAKEMLYGLSKLIKNMQPHYHQNFTDPSFGKNFEMKFSGFSGVVKPMPEKENISSEDCATLREGDSRSTQVRLDCALKNDSYYKFHEEGADWWTANRTCAEAGAHLVVIDCDEEAQLLADIFARHTNLHNDYNNKMFVGVNDLEREGVFVTVLGDELTRIGYAKWRTGNPDDWKAVNKHGEDCVEMGRDKLLNDIHCNAKLAFVCEME